MATFIRFLRLATSLESARRQAADDLDRGYSYLGYGDENAGQGEQFDGLCGYQVADTSEKPDCDYSDCPYFAYFSGTFLHRDSASDGDVFAPLEVLDVRHVTIDGDNEYSDEEMALIESADW